MIWTVIEALIVATAISFVASLQLGPVNMGTIHTALHKNKKAAIIFGLGGSLPELLYCGLAIGSSNFISQYEGLDDYLKYLTVGILLIFGVYLFLQKASTKQNNKLDKQGKELWVGATFGMLNPQLYPYWLFIITLLRSNSILENNSLPSQVAFVIGTALGAFLLQWLVAELTTRNRDFIFKKLTKNYNKVLGGILIAMALIQLVINL
ncbi:LysE family translocator [Roseivirga sp.]|uniref:LysE family translocator n=1 Tax=Roseivirga sp. TaxID=1964215 RepID=UPI003B8CBE18